jgi:hypothetical protein
MQISVVYDNFEDLEVPLFRIACHDERGRVIFTASLPLAETLRLGEWLVDAAKQVIAAARIS